MVKYTAPARIRFCLLLSFFVSFFLPCRSQPGKDGNRVISASGTVINAYTALTLDALAGSPSITVANSLLTSGASFTAPLSPGDLIMIIQPQGALISSADDSTYGTILTYGNSGRYEFCQVAAVPNGTTITLSCGLQYDYSVLGKTQIIRVPRYVRLTVNPGANVTAPAWNGSTGGVLVVEADSEVVINAGASIDMTGKGFRGGVLSENLSALGVLNYRWPTGDYGAEKGEGISGFQTDYDALSGRYCKGAPANGGGGGSGHNCGGGGGANAGDTSSWTGNGNPDVSVATYPSAWNLEYPGFSTATSTGGGRGGYSFSSANQDALTIGNYNNAWGGDYRRNNGGRGGRPLDYSTGRIFMGGGGGAGDQNDNRGGSGANGGGIVFLATRGTVSGNGAILANGNNGFNSVSSFSGNDAAGGGGAGGTVIIDAVGAVSGISISANGGRGGNQNVGLFQNDAYGPGGGGGGGYIGVSNGTIVRSAIGGANGVTNSSGLLEFPPNGATKGASGLANESFSTYRMTVNGDTICSGTSTTLAVGITGSFPSGAVMAWYSQPFDGTPLAYGATFTTPSLTSTTTYYVGPCPGYYRLPVVVLVDSVSTFFTLPSPPPCAGSPVTFTSLTASSTGTVTALSWSFSDGSPAAVGQTVMHTFDSAGSYQISLTGTDSYGCQAVFSDSIFIPAAPTATISVSDTLACVPLTTTFSALVPGALSYAWDFGDGSASAVISPTHTYTSPGNYTVNLNVATASCFVVQSVQVTALPLPDATITPTPSSGCYPLTVSFGHQQYNGANYSWDFGDGSSSSSYAPSHVFGSIGAFPVVLSVALNGCINSDTVLVTTGSPVSVSFIHDNGCFGDSLGFFSSVTGNVVSYLWDFGDGTTSPFNFTTHVYPQPGVYFAMLTVTDANGCQGSYSDSVIVERSPIVGFTSTPAVGCDTVIVVFTNTTTGAAFQNWDFGDGVTSSVVSPTHVYTQPGAYNVTLTTQSSMGCIALSSHMPAVRVYASPVVEISCIDTLICNGSCVSFADQSTGSPNQWQWTFPGAVPTTSGNAATGLICYNSVGDYDVTLTVSNATCSSSRTFSDYIQVTDCSVAPIAGFLCSDSTFCVNGCTSFISLAQNATGWNWSFPGGTPSSSSSPNPSGICYPSVGDYPVTLQVTNPAGSDVLTVTNLIHIASVPPIPSFTQTGDTLLAPQGYSGYQWYYNNVPITAAVSYRYLAMQSGNYSVAVTNSAGCRAISQPQHVSLVGVDELEADLDLEIYPNPFGSDLVLTYHGQRSVTYDVRLFDTLGRMVFARQLVFDANTGFLHMNTADLSNGAYLLVIADGNRRIVRKLFRF